ncbi:MAG: DUF2344 domain-containing protein, partial [Desulfobacteraceae bacterium]|nr:DUF2344 domain-containing protein [Desulfobacteraceae bacterium]
DSGISAKFLLQEFKKSKTGKTTPDCRENDCSGCGVCDFETLMPVVHDKKNTFKPDTAAMATRLPDDYFKKFELRFSKLGKARFFGHLEMNTIFQRAIKRAGLVVKYSQGFNPSMRISFENALPLGMESEKELMFVYLKKNTDCSAVVHLLNATLPQGLLIVSCSPFEKGKVKNTISFYRIRFKELPARLNKERIEEFFNLSQFIIEDKSKKGKTRKTDLKQVVEKIKATDHRTIEMAIKTMNNRTIRPSEILLRYFDISDDIVKTARIKKIEQGL